MHAPAWLLERLGGDLARELLLGGQKVVPRQALETGFVFETPRLEGLFETILGMRHKIGLLVDQTTTPTAATALSR
jgi:NAD dependent epimerase/dehydratase family enzyme